MGSLVEFAKQFLVPGSIGFLLVGLSLGAAGLLRKGKVRRWSRAWLAALAASYWLLSLPAVAAGLVGVLASGFGSIDTPEAAQGATGVVVLGGGSATLRAHGYELSLLSEPAGLRVLEAARLYQLLEGPWVFASGGTAAEAGVLTPESLALEQALREAGVPAHRIVLESTSRDTHEQAVALAPLLDERQVSTFILVTSPTHMRRAVLAFRDQGLEPLPSLALERSETLPPPLAGVIPSLRSLAESSAALRELFGLLYYALRGWI